MIWPVLLLAFILRIINLNQSLWLDEADNIVAAKMFNFSSFLTKYPIGDYHPPGYFVLIWLWTHLFGFSEIAVRMPSVLLGIGTIIFTYLLGKQLFNKKVALVAALFLTVAPLHVYYSQEARMYSLSAFSVSALSYFLIQMLNGKKWGVVGYVVSASLVLYSDYVTYLIFPAHFLYLLVTQQNIWKKWFASLFISLLTFLPWLTVLPQQIMEGNRAAVNLPGWKKVAGGMDFKNIALVFTKTIFGRISFDNKLIYGLLSLALTFFYGLIIYLGIKKINNTTKFLLIWFLTPLVLATLISSFIPMLSYFRMLFILPALYLLLANGIFPLPKNLAKLAGIVVVLASLIFLTIYYTNPKFQREDWKGVAAFLNKTVTNQAIILFEDNHVKFPFLYYRRGEVATFAGLKNVQAKTDRDVADVEKLVAGKKQIYVFEYLVEITDPKRLLEKRIKQMGFVQKDIYNFNGVGFIRLYVHD